MSMSLKSIYTKGRFMHPNFDKTKVNYLQKCFYMINIMKDQNHDLWENYHALYCATKANESFELYNMLLEEYKKVEAKPAPVKKSKPVAKKKNVVKKAA